VHLCIDFWGGEREMIEREREREREKEREKERGSMCMPVISVCVFVCVCYVPAVPISWMERQSAGSISSI
jgi:hypothetical protein